MSLQAVGAIVCLFLAQVAADTGVNFVMERHPDSYYCGHLQCVADFTTSDHDVSTFVGMTIYDITQVNSELKLASVSAFDQALYVDTTKSSAMSCTGIISRLQANLTLKLRHDIDCLYGVYKCQLELVTESGHPEVLTEIVIPENNHNYSRVSEVISHIDRLTGLFNIHTTLVSNQTTVINNLGSHFVDATSQLMNQTADIDRLERQLDILTTGLMNHAAEINKLGSHLDHQTTKLTDQTAEINKLGSRLDHQTTKLMNQTEEINKQESRLDNQTAIQTAEITKLGSQVDDLTAQLINLTTQLHNVSQRLDLELTQEKQQQLDTIREPSKQVADMSKDQDTCIKGQPHINETKRITLWGNTTALCDTTTDGGGWIIIQGYNKLRIDMIYQGRRVYAHYSNFYVFSEAMNYRLLVSAFEGTSGDSLTYHNNMYFSTFDRDNDKHGSNCADSLRGAWWFNTCLESNLNGLWAEQNWIGVYWKSLAASNSLSFSEMKIRRV